MSGEILAPKEQEPVRVREVALPQFLLEKFVKLIADKSIPRGVTLMQVYFGVEEERWDKDGTHHVITTPVVFEPKEGIGDAVGRYLIQQENGLTYFMEYRALIDEDSSDYFIGITQVPSPEGFEDLRKWAEEIRKRPEPLSSRTPTDNINIYPSLAIESTRYDSIRVELINEDFNLEDFYKFLTGK